MHYPRIVFFDLRRRRGSRISLIAIAFLTKQTAYQVTSKSSIGDPFAVSADFETGSNCTPAIERRQASEYPGARVRSPGHRVDGNQPDKKKRASKGPPAWIG
jgi:hypothetical protein